MESMRWSTFALIVASAAVALAQDTMMVNVAVYYESLCPDSMKFITSQLYPVYESALGKSMNLTLVPYGKATMTKNETGTYNFSCHHGEEECYGNKVQACALKILDTQGKQVKFINCLMTNSKKGMEYPLKKCADELNFGDDMISSCSNTTTGDEELAKMGMMTEKLEKTLTSVPTVVFNNMLNKTESDMAMKDFKMTLCSKIMGDKPKECMAAPSSASLATIATIFFPIATSLLISRL